MCRLICKGRTVCLTAPCPRGRSSPLRVRRRFCCPGPEKRRKHLSWYNGNTIRKLAAWQEKMAAEYRAAGMTEEAIAEIAAFDLEVMRPDRRFYRHTQALCPGVGDLKNAPEPSSEGEELRLSGRMDWLQEIESPALLEALRALKPEQECAAAEKRWHRSK